MTPHRQLLADYAESGSEEAFRQLVEDYLGLVHGTALRLVNGHSQLAEDVAQTVFTDLARQAKSLSPNIMMGGWLHRRTCFAAANAMRSERRRLNRETEAVEMNSNNSDEALAAVAPILDEAIDQLAADDRAAITLRFFESSNMRAIGEALGTSESAAQKRVERALEKLRGLLARRGVALSVTALAMAVGTASATAAPAGSAATISTAALANASAGTGFTFTTLKIMAMTKLKVAVVAAVVALAAAGTVTTVVINRDPVYTPPPHPNPGKILYEAQADAAAGRYKEALAKHIWYRKNALRYEPSQSGVRDSFALSWWAELAADYPPAMKKLITIRDTATDQFLKKGKGTRADFIVALSINTGLKEKQKNIELFKWLDVHNKAMAKFMYSLMEMDLIHAGEYALCDHYTDADSSYMRILDQYNQRLKMPKAARTSQFMDFQDNYFCNQAAVLVAVLAINKHSDDAERIASEAAKVIKTPEFATELADAKSGTVPPAWP